jgi:hypothetical protein
MFPTLILCATLVALPPDVDPAMLPGVAKLAPAEIEYAGLAALYPGAVLHGPPQATNPGNASRNLYPTDLSHNITYARLYDVGNSTADLAKLLKSNNALILDLRYLAPDAAAAEALATTLRNAGLDCAPVHAVGNIATPAKFTPPDPAAGHTPPLVLALVNRETAGPLEAWLAAFQDRESVLAVGTPTAGQPGVYQQAEDAPEYYILTGFLQPESGSIVGAGLKPRFPVDVTPEEDYRAWDTLEKDPDEFASLLQHDRSPTAPTPAPSAASAANATVATPAAAPEDNLIDPVLQRAVDVVAALQLLGRMPASSPPAAAATSSVAAPAAAGLSHASTQH